MTANDDTPEPDNAESGRIHLRPIHLYLGAAALAVIVTIVVILEYADAPPNDLWAEGSYVADPDCDPGSSECSMYIEPVPAGHGSDGSGPAISLVTYPGLDDPIAQWGRCMDTVFACLGPPDDAPPAERADRLRSCVSQAECPQACLDRYAERSGGDLDAAVDSFEVIFVAEDAWCAPRQN